MYISQCATLIPDSLEFKSQKRILKQESLFIPTDFNIKNKIHESFYTNLYKIQKEERNGLYLGRNIFGLIGSTRRNV